MSPENALLSPDRFFAPEPAQRRVAHELYAAIAELPLVCPHGHVDPRLLADDNATFGSPTDLFIIPDHYVFRMLYSQGVPLELLGVPRRDGNPGTVSHRQIWQTFADHFYLFRGTPSGVWLAHELYEVFDIRQKLSGETAQAIYDEISEKLAQPAYRPRALFERFKIDVLCTTDGAGDSLVHHKAIKESGWQGVVRPTFRPDAVTNLAAAGWRENLTALGQACGREITTVAGLISALEERRAYFKSMGATATDSGVESPYTAVLSSAEAEAIFARALAGAPGEPGGATAEDARRFTGHMLIEMARMSAEDGLVMQMHAGSFRNHNPAVFDKFGADKGCDIPVATEFTYNLKPLLDRFGSDPRLTLILFTLDETNYSRELATLAGHYPALKLGPPWWFHDSLNGTARYFDQVMETAGLYNTAGFNDDTRAFVSIPARHDVWRRASANWLAGLVVRGMIEMADAVEMAPDMANGLARRTYKL